MALLAGAAACSLTGDHDAREVVATSALPDAPVRTQRTKPTPRRHAPAAKLRRGSASLLVGLAGRLDPDTQTMS